MRCPRCTGEIEELKGSPISPYINTYMCTGCGWLGYRCGDTSCDGYLTVEEIGMATTVRYNCATCGWTGTGVRVA